MRSTLDRSTDDSGRGGSAFRLTRAGWAWFCVTLFLGGIGWYKSLNVVLLLAYIMSLLLVLNGVLARSHARRVTARRTPLVPAMAGEEIRIEVIVANESTRAACVEIVEPIGGQARWFLDPLPAGTRQVLSVRQVFPQRGRFASGHPHVRSAYPFGFVRYQVPDLATAHELIVLPAQGHANAEGLRRWVQRQIAGEGRARKVLRRVTTDQADVRGVRPFRSGDSIRAIHWRTTARRRELFVCEYDTAPSPELLVVLEPWLPSQPTPQEIETLEAHLSLAVTILVTWSRAFATKVSLVIAGGNSRTAGSASGGEEYVREMMTPLADLAGIPQSEEPAAEAIGRPAAARVLLTTRSRSSLPERLQTLANRPVVVVTPGQQLPWYQAPQHSSAIEIDLPAAP